MYVYYMYVDIHCSFVWLLLHINFECNAALGLRCIYQALLYMYCTGSIILMSGPPVKKVRQSSILESFPLQPKEVKMAPNDTTVKTTPSVDETID